MKSIRENSEFNGELDFRDFYIETGTSFRALVDERMKIFTRFYTALFSLVAFIGVLSDNGLFSISSNNVSADFLYLLISFFSLFGFLMYAMLIGTNFAISAHGQILRSQYELYPMPGYENETIAGYFSRYTSSTNSMIAWFFRKINRNSVSDSGRYAVAIPVIAVSLFSSSIYMTEIYLNYQDILGYLDSQLVYISFFEVSFLPHDHICWSYAVG